MTTTPTYTPLIVKLTKHLPLLERLFLGAFIVGMILRILHLDSTIVTMALFGLAATFFLYAYKQADIPIQENEQLGFQELLGLSIVPKVLWISSAVSTLGIAFYLFHLGNNGYKKMLMIGVLSIGAGALLLIILLAKGMNHVKTVMPVLLRAIPLFLVALYILFI